MTEPRYDLLIAGGGPTGLAAAILAARHGLSVLVLDPQDGAIDKACGEGLMPCAVADLADLGVDILVHHEFRGIRYVQGDDIAEGKFPVGVGWGVRRTVLHEALGRRADALGVTRIRERVSTLVQHPTHVTVGGHEASWMIAADGLHSPVRKLLGVGTRLVGRRRYGLRRHFAVPPWSDTVDVYWSDDAEAYVTPVGPNLVGVAFLYGDAARSADAGKPGTPFERLLGRFPSLAERLDHPATTPRGAGPFHQMPDRRVIGRVLLAGDAAGYVDPITGEGIKLGISTARAAVDAIVAGTPERYEAAWWYHTRAYRWLTTGLVRITAIPMLRARLVPILRRVPWLFRRILGILATP